MSDREVDTATADREAADWLARLGARPVSADTLAEFQAWRTAPENVAAYRRAEAIWRRSGELSNDAEITALVQATLARPRPRRKKGVGRGAAIGGGLAVIGAVALAFGYHAWSSRMVYATPIGELRTVSLADGSTVRLDTASRVRVRLSDDRRVVILESGQALFEVAHDATRPFVVEAGTTEVQALGTVFDVRREGPGGVRVTLVEGAVEVRERAPEARQTHRLSAGQQWKRASGSTRPAAVDVAVATSWAEGRLRFRNTPLREAVAEVNRYLEDKIVLDAGAAEAVGVNGTFAIGDRNAFVSAASDLFGLQAREASDGSLHLSKRSGD